MKQELKNIIIYVAIIALIILQFVRVEPYIVWSSETYIGAFVTLMGVAVTFVIGYQILSTIDVKGELKEQRTNNDKLREEINKLTSENKEMTERIQALTSEAKENIAILDADRIITIAHFIPPYFDAFVKAHQALLSGLGYDSPNYAYIMDKMREYKWNIRTDTFGRNFINEPNKLTFGDGVYKGRTLKDVVENDFMPVIKETDEAIRSHKRFSCISHDYLKLMDSFYKRIDKCTSSYFPQNEDELDED